MATITAQEELLKEHIFRVNKAIDYIRLNIDNEISLKTLSEISNFSKFHFHRIFKSVTGITPNDYITQLKLVKATYYLSNSSFSVTNIALDAGFSNVSSFSKCFKRAYNKSPLHWKEEYMNENSKMGKQHSNIGQKNRASQNYLAPVLLNQKEIIMERQVNFEIEVKNLKDLPIVYVRDLSVHVHDAERFQKMFTFLMNWAKQKELLNFPETQALTVYRSLPDEKGMVQADVCLSVPENIKGSGIIGRSAIEGGTYAVIHKEGSFKDCFSACDFFYNEWLPQSGYEPDSRGVFLNHLNTPKDHPQGFHIIDMYFSIKSIG